MSDLLSQLKASATLLDQGETPEAIAGRVALQDSLGFEPDDLEGDGCDSYGDE